MEAYNRSYLLRYLEEALAQSYVQIRTYGARSSIYGIKFPVRNGYLEVSKMRAEAQGILLGPVILEAVINLGS